MNGDGGAKWAASREKQLQMCEAFLDEYAPGRALPADGAHGSGGQNSGHLSSASSTSFSSSVKEYEATSLNLGPATLWAAATALTMRLEGKWGTRSWLLKVAVGVYLLLAVFGFI